MNSDVEIHTLGCKTHARRIHAQRHAHGRECDVRDDYGNAEGSKSRSVFPLGFRIRCYMYGIGIKAEILASDVALVGFNSDSAVC